MLAPTNLTIESIVLMSAGAYKTELVFGHLFGVYVYQTESCSHVWHIIISTLPAPTHHMAADADNYYHQ